VTPAVEVTDLTKYYGSDRGVVDVDLAVEPGQVFGFLGPNGAGKTTTMRMLLDFIRPDSGTARVLGLDCQTDSLAIRSRTGYVGGDVALYERLTGRELCLWLADLRGGAGADRIDDLADRLGLDLGRPIGDLSTGNRQKVALVQAFMHEPELLVLDEPTAGLDPLVQHTFQQMVAEVAAEGRSVFLSSHVLDEVERTCDRVAIIRDGRLVTVEEMATLRRRALRDVTIRFAEPVDLEPIKALDEVHEASADEDVVQLRFGGEADALIKLLAGHRVIDFISAPADLEDIFLAFYSGDHAEDGPEHG
jgi:ABC-2 type transport system ATP-binding protein